MAGARPRARARCPIGARELSRRRRRVRDRVGRQVLELRIEAGIAQATLAAAADIDPGHLSRIEHGTAKPSLDVLVAISACLGADLGVRLFPGSGPRLTDRFQAPIIEALIRILHPRWIPMPELPVPKAHGFVDLALAVRGESTGVACEAQSELRAIDVVQRRLLEKALAVADLGIVGTTVSPLLLVRSTSATRAVVRLYESTLGATFPAPTAATYAALVGEAQAWPGPALLWAKLVGGRAEILGHPPRGIRLGR